MFEQIMNSQKTVSKEEVEKFRDIYGDDYNEEESAAMLLLNKENLDENVTKDVLAP